MNRILAATMEPLPGLCHCMLPASTTSIRSTKQAYTSRVCLMLACLPYVYICLGKVWQDVRWRLASRVAQLICSNQTLLPLRPP
jgi:hypothetical protein